MARRVIDGAARPADASAPAPSRTSEQATAGLARGGTGALHAVGGMGHGTVPQRRLLVLLARLKWTLWKRSFRKNVGKLIGTIIGVLYGIGGLVGLTLALGAAALLIDGAAPDAFGLLMRGVGAAVVLVWLLLPLFAFGIDDTLDPRRFATLPRSARELQAGLFAASAISLPSLFTVLGALIATVCEVLWLVSSSGAGAVPLVAALALMLPANLLGIALCLLLPRAILAQSSTRQSSRRGRELGGVIAMIAMIGAIYGVSLLGQVFAEADLDRVAAILGGIVRGLAWTPLAAAFSAPLDIAEGHALVGILRLLIALAAVVLVWLWWRRSIGLALRSALIGDSTSGDAKVAALVPRLAPQSALGASWGRSLRYWRRDARYLAAIAIMPVLALFFLAMGMLAEPQRPFAVIGVVFVSGLSAIAICNEIGFDGPAGWVNLTAGLDSRANLWGRILALATFSVPFAVVAGVLVPLLLGLAPLIPLALLGSLGAMMGAWGVSCLIAVTLPYPTSPPGTNPLRDRSASSANAMIASFAAMIGVWVPQIPAIVLAVVGLVTGSTALQLLAGGVSTACGAMALWMCVRGAARILDRRYVDLFQKVRAFV